KFYPCGHGTHIVCASRWNDVRNGHGYCPICRCPDHGHESCRTCQHNQPNVLPSGPPVQESPPIQPRIQPIAPDPPTTVPTIPPTDQPAPPTDQPAPPDPDF